MRDFNDALDDIQSIRRQMARTTEFRGYGPATLSATALIAVLASVAQIKWVPDAVNHFAGYLGVWITAALVSASLAGAQMYKRSRRIHSDLSDEMMLVAVLQFLPSLVASLLLTVVIVWFVPAIEWILPGIWQINFSLGVFSSCRFLPRPMLAAGAWYLITSLICIALGDGRALSAWGMGIPFAVGQLIVASVLFFAARAGEDEN
jgi:hypothetical protein